MLRKMQDASTNLPEELSVRYEYPSPTEDDIPCGSCLAYFIRRMLLNVRCLGLSSSSHLRLSEGARKVDTTMVYCFDNRRCIDTPRSVFLWGLPPNRTPEDFLGLSFWKLKFRFKIRMNTAQEVVYQCFLWRALM